MTMAAIIIRSVLGILSTMGVTIHPLIGEWLIHYAEGSRKEKTLPVEYHLETRRAVLKVLTHLWRYPDWDVNTAWAGEEDISLKENPLEWFSSLAGVIGSFNFRLIPEEKGLRIPCQDTWDFNSNGNWKLQLPIPKAFAGFIQTFLDKNEIEHSVLNGMLYIEEGVLSRFNEGHAFMTKWELFIPWEEFEFPEGLTPHEINWELGGLPKSWVKAKAAQKWLLTNFPDWDCWLVTQEELGEELYPDDPSPFKWVVKGVDASWNDFIFSPEEVYNLK